MDTLKFVALQSLSSGNATVGQVWTEVATFRSTATLDQVWDWALKVRATGMNGGDLRIVLENEDSPVE